MRTAPFDGTLKFCQSEGRRLKPCVTGSKDSAREIREYFIPDFSNWKDHDSYQEAFQSLLRDLKSADSKAK
jgi:hypothetical protein